MQRKFLAILSQSLFLLFVIMIAGLAGWTVAHANQAPLTFAPHVPGEIILKHRSAIQAKLGSENIRKTLNAKFGPDSVTLIQGFKTEDTLTKIKIKNDQDMQVAIETLEAQPEIQYAEPNYLYHVLDLIPNDTDFEKQWDMRNHGQPDTLGKVGLASADIHVSQLWEKGYTGSKDILVAVIDTGVQWEHPDLADNIFTYNGGIPEDTFKDDKHGWNFVANTSDTHDDHNHGTHCSGVIGAIGNNKTGISGVNWAVSILPVKFLDATGGGTLEGAVEAINYARIMKVKIMSNSWGGGAFAQSMLDAIHAARDAGILFIAAAGNDSMSNDDAPSYPASYDSDNIISVAATDNQDKLADFSNYGRNTVHVAAPGVNIYSTVKGSLYDTMSGTSMATPHVAGVAALLLAANPTWTYQTVKSRLIATSDHVPSLRRKVVAKGRVDAYNAMYNIVPPSDEPDESLWKDMAMRIESPHPYLSNSDLSYPVSVPGAKYIRIVFDKLETERNYDKVMFLDKTGTVVDQMSGILANYTTDYVIGDTATLRLTSDSSVNAFGFTVTKIQVIK